MSDAKTYVFGQDSNSTLNALLPLLQQKGIDPSVFAMMNNGGFGNGNWIWIFFLILLFGRNGFGGFGDSNIAGTGYLSNQITNTAGRDLLMQAITGNGAAVQNLASNLNCDINSIKGAINGVQTSIMQVGNQVGMSGQQVINAIQQGNMGLTQQIAQCCCDNKLLVTNMGYEGQLRDQTNTAAITTRIGELANGITQGFSATAYETAQQTCALQNGLRDQTQTILNKLDAIEDSRKDREIANLTAQLTASTSRAERAAELEPIKQALSEIGCKQPNTVTVPYQPFVTVPNCVAWNATYGAGYNANPGVWG